MKRAYFSFGHSRNGRRTEWWTVSTGSTFKSISIQYDEEWFHREGSINDLKAMAIGAAE